MGLSQALDEFNQAKTVVTNKLSALKDMVHNIETTIGNSIRPDEVTIKTQGISLSYCKSADSDDYIVAIDGKKFIENKMATRLLVTENHLVQIVSRAVVIMENK